MRSSTAPASIGAPDRPVVTDTGSAQSAETMDLGSRHSQKRAARRAGFRRLLPLIVYALVSLVLITVSHAAPPGERSHLLASAGEYLIGGGD